jgi:hypothetical protein
MRRVSSAPFSSALAGGLPWIRISLIAALICSANLWLGRSDVQGVLFAQPERNPTPEDLTAPPLATPPAAAPAESSAVKHRTFIDS